MKDYIQLRRDMFVLINQDKLGLNFDLIIASNTSEHLHNSGSLSARLQISDVEPKSQHARGHRLQWRVLISHARITNNIKLEHTPHMPYWHNQHDPYAISVRWMDRVV